LYIRVIQKVPTSEFGTILEQIQALRKMHELEYFFSGIMPNKSLAQTLKLPS